MSLIAAVYNAVIGMRKRTWASGMTVRKNEIVKSPADNEDYERITATGGGTTDPADDVVNYVARSYVRTAGIVPAKQLGAYLGDMNTAGGHVGATRVVLGAIAVGARTLALDITGRGVIDYLATSKANSGTYRVEVIVDGRVVSDETTTGGYGKSDLYVGSPTYGEATYQTQFAIRQPDGIVFKRSFAVYLTAVSLAGGIGCGVAYNARSQA
jgi:hypothetical protein